MRRMRTTAEGSSIRVMAMKLVVESPCKNIEVIFMWDRHVLPDIGVLSEVDLVSAERRREGLKTGREIMFLLSRPECESIIDEGDDWPDDKEGEGNWKHTWVEAVQDGVPQH